MALALLGRSVVKSFVKSVRLYLLNASFGCEEIGQTCSISISSRTIGIVMLALLSIATVNVSLPAANAATRIGPESGVIPPTSAHYSTAVNFGKP